jgi:hypothetical protein
MNSTNTTREDIMKLSKVQLEYIKDRRAWMEQREKDIRSLGDELYKSDDLTRELIQMSQEHTFFNHMIRLHNVEAKAEKASFEALKDEDEKEMTK